MSAAATVIRHVAVVGTGVIGASWAAFFLARGLDVTATDPAPGAEQRLREAVQRHWPTMQRMGLADGASPERLRFDAALERALDGCDFVQESGPERADFKADLYARMDAATPSQVLLASSSSGLPVSGMQARCKTPQRVVLGHPFNPPHLIPLVEVGGGDATSPDSIQRAMDFYAALGKRPIHVRREIAGHIANRLQAALWREAFHLVDQGVASVSDIDTAIAHGPGLRWALMGPFMNLHLSGGQGGMQHLLEHLGGPIESWWRDLGNPAMTEALKDSVVQGVAEARGMRREEELERTRDELLTDLIRAKVQGSLF
ncbi:MULTISPECIES: 3-hydroxyacyl-CoA dehydrogenase NAD-binding domain-containing protein [Comamonas]|uniref:3-hydroxyacyl-CoA dehydrogenase NAD-binding domain-containing protein n=1 Tax=Comamonas TaxID=283 RepID=UPI000622A34C|nr:MULTISPECIES: 3-hydroxyacyl-CoA dehydrogenase NAD-binding domain-containing protein [Comamonas]KKI14447.1 3-hydroxyacyl-CoA dehydrogenase [Comamonas thiooxydans]TYK75355.1 3-hydroxyacyl-CoA dehydrogenase [Comamonas sp. Z1]BCX50624.1 hydroxyacyl-CoA dehydrogenase [Comamonas testosteroni]